MAQKTRYAAIIEKIFLSTYRRGMRQVEFEREDIARVAQELQITLPKNLGDVIYSFRYRTPLPEKIRSKAGPEESWIIRSIGRSKYRFVLDRKSTRLNSSHQLILYAAFFFKKILIT